MARPLRLNVPGGLYHVTARGVDRCAIFRDDNDRQLFLRLLAETVGRFGWLLHAFSLMLTHFHLMPETPRGNLSQGMGWLKSVYAATFNHRHGRVGHLFDDRFKSRLIQNARYGRNAHHYIQRNPVEAGLVEVPWQDPWNSSRYFIGFEPAPKWLHTDWMLSQFETREQYIEALLRPVGDIEAEAIGAAVLGDRAFAAGFVTDQILANPEISRRIDLRQLWDPASIMAALAAEGIVLEGLKDDRKSRSAHRSLLMFLLRELGGVPISQVAEQAGITKGAVSRRVSALQGQVAQDAALAEIVRRVAVRLADLEG